MSDQEYKYPWRNEELMRELYWEEGLSQGQITEKLNTTQKTVSDWMKRLGIETRDWTIEELRDAEWLREQYEEMGKSTLEIADDLDCTHRSVRVWMKKHGIERRKSTREKPPYFYTTQDGYEIVKSKVNGETKSVRVHRLLAVAEKGVEAVSGKQIHHVNHIPWDNRSENIEIVDSSEHGLIHSKKRERDEKGNYA